MLSRLIDTKKSLSKAKGKQLSKDMIGLPQADFIHAFHIGVSGKNESEREIVDGKNNIPLNE